MQSIKLLVHVGYGDQSCVHMYTQARTKVSAKRSLAGFENTCSTVPFAHCKFFFCQECFSNSMNDTSLVNLQQGLNFYCFLQILSSYRRDALKKESFPPTSAPSLPVQPHQPQQQYHHVVPEPIHQCRDDSGRMDQPTSYDQPTEIPFDPNLVCLKCGRQFRRGEVQKFMKHHERCNGR